jgi:hypothetical protein
MGRPLGVIRAGLRTADEIAGHSRGALDRPLGPPPDGAPAAQLWVAVLKGPSAVSLGAFQRAEGRGIPEAWRGSGGPSVLLGEGTVHVALALAHPAALVPCDEHRIVNRYVRPLLGAVTRAMPRAAGAKANFFGSDWIDVRHRPVAWVGFGHDSLTRRTLFEAFVAARTPFASAGRASFRGKVPATLEDVAGGPVDAQGVAEAIVDAYVAASGEPEIAVPRPLAAPAVDHPLDPPWASTYDEAIGIVAAGSDARGAFRIGGDLLVSRDALARLERRIEAGDDPSRAVDETLAAPGVALDGVRSLTSVRDVILRARAPRSELP